MQNHHSFLRHSSRAAAALLLVATLACGDGGEARTGDSASHVSVDSGSLATAAPDSVRPAFGDTALTPSQTTASADAVPQPGVTTQPGPGAPSSAATPSAAATGTTSGTAPAPPAVVADSPRVDSVAAAVLPTTPEPAPAASATPTRRAVPFGPGEKLTYDVKFGPLRVGSGVMEVRGIEEVRGASAWHTRFTVKGSALGVKVDDLYESWFDVTTLSSLRHMQDVDQGPYERKRTFEIFPDRKSYIEQVEGKEPRKGTSVADPLDDGSFIYFIRAMPELEVGKTYTFNNYFRPDRNPVRVTVVRRERIEVPAGKFNAIVLRPSIKTKGMFAEGSAEIWLSDDTERTLLQLKSKLPVGTLNLYLRKRQEGTAP